MRLKVGNIATILIGLKYCETVASAKSKKVIVSAAKVNVKFYQR
jgi:hypothetical protein